MYCSKRTCKVQSPQLAAPHCVRCKSLPICCRSVGSATIPVPFVNVDVTFRVCFRVWVHPQVADGRVPLVIAALPRLKWIVPTCEYQPARARKQRAERTASPSKVSRILHTGDTPLHPSSR